MLLWWSNTTFNAEFPLLVDVAVTLMLHCCAWITFTVILAIISRILLVTNRFRRIFTDRRKKNKDLHMQFISVQTFNEDETNLDVYALVGHCLLSLLTTLVLFLYICWKNNPDLISNLPGESGQTIKFQETKSKVIIWLTGIVLLLQSLVSWFRFIWRDKSLLPLFRDKIKEIKVVVKPPVYKNKNKEDQIFDRTESDLEESKTWSQSQSQFSDDDDVMSNQKDKSWYEEDDQLKATDTSIDDDDDDDDYDNATVEEEKTVTDSDC